MFPRTSPSFGLIPRIRPLRVRVSLSGFYATTSEPRGFLRIRRIVTGFPPLSHDPDSIFELQLPRKSSLTSLQDHPGVSTSLEIPNTTCRNLRSRSPSSGFPFDTRQYPQPLQTCSRSFLSTSANRSPTLLRPKRTNPRPSPLEYHWDLLVRRCRYLFYAPSSTEGRRFKVDTSVPDESSSVPGPSVPKRGHSRSPGPERRPVRQRTD